MNPLGVREVGCATSTASRKGRGWRMSGKRVLDTMDLVCSKQAQGYDELCVGWYNYSTVLYST